MKTLGAGCLVVIAIMTAGCASSRSRTAAGSVSALPTVASASTPAGSAASAPATAAPLSPFEAAASSPGATSPTPTAPSSAPVLPTAGSTGLPPQATHASATVGATVVACPDANAVAQPASALPPDVAVSAVVRCENLIRSYPDLGSWSVQTAEVATNSLDAFVAQMRTPSDPARSGVVCPLFRIAVPWFVLLDSHGNELRAAMPTTECGQVKGAVLTAFNALPFVEVAAARLSPAG